MAEKLQPIPLKFWKSDAGNEPVRVWLSALPREDRRTVGRDIGIAQFGWPLGLPLCRSLSGGLWEIRSSLPSRREARVLFGFHEGEMVALHAFIKKTQRTPQDELTLARKRLKALIQ